MSKQQQIFEFITTTLNPDSKVAFDAGQNLLEAGVLDSVAMMELIVWLEEQFKIAIEADDLTPDNFATLDAMAKYVERAANA